jgi:polysaccharide export outer membrane protein
MYLQGIVKKVRDRAASFGALAVALACASCASNSNIANVEPVALGDGYQAQYRAEAPIGAAETLDSASLNAKRCKDADHPTPELRDAMIPPDKERLSAGDLVEVIVGSDELLSRTYKVSQEGALRLPNLQPVRAQGRTVEAIEAAITEKLVSSGLYAGPPAVSVRVTDTAGARVFVSGAVFEPGAEIVGGITGNNIDAARQKALGWTAEGRRLARALQSAGGVRPDADLAHVKIRRVGSTLSIDVRAALTGRPFSDIILLDGDQIEVPSRGCFQEALMAPASITTPGIKVFMYNLTLPAAGNAISAISKDTTELRYGTRFIQAIVAMNCVGGVRSTNADRSAVLFTRNPVTGASIVVSRQIEDLEQRSDRDDYNPYLLPGDAIACYDSGQTNIFAIAQGISAISQGISSTTSVTTYLRSQ